ncbi:hypothetical protein M6B38_147540 [Iris pallida]|uniref:Uncharacterized protein n=1 Tax=Iris pallida TaxID=29817 RepID=A0AAX6F7P0_IRIPA|nr:hypothetical protein M6B38_147540 [Iris pallida]
MRRSVSYLTRRGHLMASNVDDRTVARCSGKGEAGRVLILFIDRPGGKPRSGRAELRTRVRRSASSCGNSGMKKWHW